MLPRYLVDVTLATSIVQGVIMLNARITELQRQCAVPLVEMKSFYHARIGLPVVVDNDDQLTLQVRQSRLAFTPSLPHSPAPYYHFAIDMPHNKIRQAYNWQQQKTPLLPLRPERYASMHQDGYPYQVRST